LLVFNRPGYGFNIITAGGFGNGNNNGNEKVLIRGGAAKAEFLSTNSEVGAPSGMGWGEVGSSILRVRGTSKVLALHLDHGIINARWAHHLTAPAHNAPPPLQIEVPGPAIVHVISDVLLFSKIVADPSNAGGFRKVKVAGSYLLVPAALQPGL